MSWYVVLMPSVRKCNVKSHENKRKKINFMSAKLLKVDSSYSNVSRSVPPLYTTSSDTSLNKNVSISGEMSVEMRYFLRRTKLLGALLFLQAFFFHHTWKSILVIVSHMTRRAAREKGSAPLGSPLPAAESIS